MRHINNLEGLSLKSNAFGILLEDITQIMYSLLHETKIEI